MKISHLRIIVFVNAMGSLALLLWASGMLFGDVNPRREAVAAEWTPPETLLTTIPPPGQRHISLLQAQSRPLFQKARRPFVPATPAERDEPDTGADVTLAPEPSPPFDPARLVLKGVWKRGDKAKALIVSDMLPEGVWLEQGAMIHGWTVSSLDFEGATLVSGTAGHRLQLYVDNPPN